MIVRRYPWQDDRPDARILWRKATYGDQGDVIYCDRYGDAEGEVVSLQDVPSVEDCREAYRRYYKYVIKTAHDPLNELWYCASVQGKLHNFVARFERIRDPATGQFLTGHTYQAGLAEVRQNRKIIFPADTTLPAELVGKLDVERSWLPAGCAGAEYMYRARKSWSALEAMPGAKVSTASVTLQFQLTLAKLPSEKENMRKLRKEARAALLALDHGGGPYLC